MNIAEYENAARVLMIKIDDLREKNTELQSALAECEKERKRLKERLQATEDYIDLIPCDYDIFPALLAAYQKWQALKKANGEK